MADDSTLLASFREELIAAGLGRRPSDAGATAGPPYPVLIEPGEGAPAPGELPDEWHDHDELVLSLFIGGELGESSGYDAAVRRRVVVDVRYRSAGNPALRAAMGVDAAIRDRLVRPETNYGYGFDMGGPGSPVLILAAQLWAGLGPISRRRGARGPEFDHVAKWLLETSP